MKRQRFRSVWDAIESSPAQAANMKARSEMMLAIRDTVASWEMTQAAAAKRLGLTQPRMNDLVRGRINKFSLDALINLAARAGLSIRVEVVGLRRRKKHVRPAYLRHRPHPRLPGVVGGDGARARLRAPADRDRRCRRALAGISGDQSQRPAAGHRRRWFCAVRVAGDHALSRQEAFARKTLSRHAGRRGEGLAVELLGHRRGRSRRQYLVAARRAPAARRSAMPRCAKRR